MTNRAAFIEAERARDGEWGLEATCLRNFPTTGLKHARQSGVTMGPGDAAIMIDSKDPSTAAVGTEPQQGWADNPIVSLLDRMEHEGCLYVSWKNNHELLQSLAGESDLDLFVPRRFRRVFVTLCSESGWVNLENPVAQFPHISHHYRVSSNGTIHHLHVYFKVVTGETWLKEFVLPFGDFLLENRVRSEVGGVWILSPPAQAYLFMIRHLLKAGSLTSRRLYKKDIDSYEAEWRLCGRSATQTASLGPIDLTRYLVGAGLDRGDFKRASFVTAIQCRLSLLPFLRLRLSALVFHRVAALSTRISNLIWYRKKKVFPRGGFVVALTGVDGSGKSTMLNEMADFYSQFLTVERYQLGRPQGALTETVRGFFARRRGSTDPAARVSGGKKSVPSTTSKAVRAVALSALRLRMARRATRSASRGHLVLVDRWPTAILGKMDGPQIVVDDDRSRMIVRLCGALERWAYSRMPRADVCLVLTLPLHTAVNRNRLRVKQGKETDQEIKWRFETNEKILPLAERVVEFHNDGELELMRDRLLLVTWGELAAQ